MLGCKAHVARGADDAAFVRSNELHARPCVVLGQRGREPVVEAGGEQMTRGNNLHHFALKVGDSLGDLREVQSALAADDVAVQLSFARKVVVVPGYGMAVAQAQHDVRQLADLLEEKGVDVNYAIHPVAGRMPGHMNVLLAEANVPYTQLFEIDEINPEFPQTDVALVIGANDVTNPAARSDPGSPIYGMPIIDADKARTVLAIKRSKNPGFAGIDNELYVKDNTWMLFGDAKAVLGDLVKQFSTSGMH